MAELQDLRPKKQISSVANFALEVRLNTLNFLLQNESFVYKRSAGLSDLACARQTLQHLDILQTMLEDFFVLF